MSDATERKLYAAADAARREQWAAEVLRGRRWHQAPAAWWQWQMARLEQLGTYAALEPREWDEIAGREIRDAVWRFRADRQDLRNPFGPHALERVDELVEAVAAWRGQSSRVAASIVEELQPLAERLSPDRVREYIRAEVARRQAVAADPVLLTKDLYEEDGRRVLAVQHQASGLRARFYYGGDDAVGMVLSKPYGLDSIDPRRREIESERGTGWERYIGLGIGRRIYLKAAEELPQVRWGGNSISRHAQWLRRGLHTADPWRWLSTNCTCQHQWHELTPETAGQVEHHQTLPGETPDTAKKSTGP